MYAVVRTGGKQYRVEPGIEFMVERLAVEPGTMVNLTDVLMTADETAVAVGKPVLMAKVVCKCLCHEKGEKLRTVKYRRRKNYKRHYGHRQTYTRLLVESVENA